MLECKTLILRRFYIPTSKNIYYIYGIMKCYRHYKGGLYKCLAIAKDSETLKYVVVYQALYGDKLIWVRDYEMFFGQVVVDGIEKRRFEEIEISEEDLISYGKTGK